MVASESVFTIGPNLTEILLRQIAVGGSSRQTFPPGQCVLILHVICCTM